MNNLIDKIILVDDDEDDRDLFVEAYQSLNLRKEFAQFKSGQELLDQIQEIDTSIAALLFLDLNMPIISGMEVLKCLRKIKKLDGIFVAIYSTSSSIRDVESAYINGANAYIKKPSSFRQLSEMICKAVEASNTHFGEQLPREEFVLNQN